LGVRFRRGSGPASIRAAHATLGDALRGDHVGPPEALHMGRSEGDRYNIVNERDTDALRAPSESTKERREGAASKFLN
jgi:hypothetical protein